MNIQHLHPHFSTPSDWDLLVLGQEPMVNVRGRALTIVGFRVFIDVIRGRVVDWTASNVFVPLPLVYPNVVD